MDHTNHNAKIKMPILTCKIIRIQKNNANVSLWQDHEDARLWAHIIYGVIAMIKKDILPILKMMDHGDNNTNNSCLETGIVTVAFSRS